jgi:hypothetical protein
MFKITYTPKATELGKACFYFMERKPLLRLCILLFNGMATFLILVMLLKLFLGMLAWSDLLILFMSLTWLCWRKRMLQWLMIRRMQNHTAKDKALTITVCANGITWSGQGIRQSQINWRHLTYVLEINNGFILPATVSRFLWLPFHGFASAQDIEHCRALMLQKSLPIKYAKKLSC